MQQVLYYNVMCPFATESAATSTGESSFAGWPDARWPDLSTMMSESKDIKMGERRKDAMHVGEDVPATPAQVCDCDSRYTLSGSQCVRCNSSQK